MTQIVVVRALFHLEFDWFVTTDNFQGGLATNIHPDTILLKIICLVIRMKQKIIHNN